MKGRKEGHRRSSGTAGSQPLSPGVWIGCSAQPGAIRGRFFQASEKSLAAVVHVHGPCCWTGRVATVAGQDSSPEVPWFRRFETRSIGGAYRCRRLVAREVHGPCVVRSRCYSWTAIVRHKDEVERERAVVRVPSEIGPGEAVGAIHLLGPVGGDHPIPSREDVRGPGGVPARTHQTGSSLVYSRVTALLSSQGERHGSRLSGPSGASTATHPRKEQKAVRRPGPVSSSGGSRPRAPAPASARRSRGPASPWSW